MAKLPSPSSPSRWETGEAPPCVGSGRIGRAGPRWRLGREGKGRGKGGDPIPLPNSGYGGVRRRLHVGRLRRR